MTTPKHVRLTRCSDAEYEDFAALQVIEYANQLVGAGEAAPQDAPVTARKRLDDLVMDHLRTTGHTFFTPRRRPCFEFSTGMGLPCGCTSHTVERVTQFARDAHLRKQLPR